MDKDTAEQTSIVAWWWMIGIGLLAATIVLITITVMGIAPWTTAKQREINQQSQQKQDSLIREARSDVTGIHNPNSSEQKQYLIDQFCPKFTEIKSPPPDLVSAHTQYC